MAKHQDELVISRQNFAQQSRAIRAPEWQALIKLTWTFALAAQEACTCKGGTGSSNACDIAIPRATVTWLQDTVTGHTSTRAQLERTVKEGAQ